MDGPLPQEMSLSLKDMLDAFGKQMCQFVEDNTKKSQEELQIGLTTTRDELAVVKGEVEATKAMLKNQGEFLTGCFNRSPTDDMKPEYVEVLLDKRVSHPDATMRDMDERKGLLAEEHAKLETIYANLHKDHQNLLTEYKELKGVLNETQTRLDDSEKKQRALRVQVGRLQGHLTRNATNANELIDSEVKAKLAHIIARAQAIVKKYCVGRGTPITRTKDEQELDEFDRELTKKMKPLLDRHAQQDIEEFATYWVRSKIYAILERDIFKQMVFGLDDDLETKLAVFEGLIAKYNPNSDIGDWRALTLRYSKALRMRQENLPKKTALYISKLFAPWIAANAQYHIIQRGIKKYQNPPQLELDLTEICQAAYDLAVMLRQSTDRYYLVPIEEGTKVEAADEEFFEPDDMIGPKAKYVGSKVWVTLFGALVKESQTGDRHVMQKARVICKALHPLPERPRDE